MKTLSTALMFLIAISMAIKCMAQSTDEVPHNGIIVNANDEAEAVQAALRRFIDHLNASINGHDEADDEIKSHFGGWLKKRSQLSTDTQPTNKEKLHFMLSSKGHDSGGIQSPSQPARRIGSTEGSVGSFVAILPLKNAPFEFAALFFQVEAIDKVSFGKYDIAFIPGMIFVGEPHIRAK